MRLLGHTSTTSRTNTPHTAEGWVREHQATAPSPARISSTAAEPSEIERLAKANRELKAALVRLIAFAGPRTALVNECGDRITDPHVLNAKAVLAAVEADI